MYFDSHIHLAKGKDVYKGWLHDFLAGGDQRLVGVGTVDLRLDPAIPGTTGRSQPGDRRRLWPSRRQGLHSRLQDTVSLDGVSEESKLKVMWDSGARLYGLGLKMRKQPR
jgi:hypothetical protein